MGLENGDIKVGDRNNFSIYTQQRFLQHPVLKIDQVMEAVLIQHKDPKGTILICKPPAQSTRYEVKVVNKLETMNTTFTTFAATTLISASINNHLTIVTQDERMSHMPKVWLMNQTCDEVLTTRLIEAIPNTSLQEVKQHASHILKQQMKEAEQNINGSKKNGDGEEKSKFTGGTKSRGKGKKGKKGKKGAKKGHQDRDYGEEDEEEGELVDFVESRFNEDDPVVNHSTKEQTLQSMVKPLEGSISCIEFADACDTMADPELFIGFESGAIGMFKLQMDESDDGYKILVVKLFTGQKVI